VPSHTIICGNCRIKVARTPNSTCINCGALDWKKQAKTSYKVQCENCNTSVAKTSDSICINCGATNWEKLNSKKFSFWSIVNLLLCICLTFLIIMSITVSKENQIIKAHYFALNHVQFGMLSVKEWKTRVADILVTKIDEFELTGENRGQIKNMIEKGLYTAIREIDSIIQQKKGESLLRGFIIRLVEDLALNIDDFKSQVPNIAEEIMRDLDNETNQSDLKVMIKQKLIEYLDKTIQDENYSNLTTLLSGLGCSSKGDCIEMLENQGGDISRKLTFVIIGVILLFFMITLLTFVSSDLVSVFGYIYSTMCILIGGVSLPMIDIDARIEQFQFLLIGEPLSFTNQVLFFQSKSILEVVTLLFKNAAIESILVAFLILLFSVIFPFIKILSSCFYLNRPSIANNKIMSFMIFRSAKWSMADVFVVAVFMAYIGFRSIIKNQLGQLNSIDDKLEILTMDNTTFQYGFLLFISFTLASLFIPYFINQKHA